MSSGNCIDLRVSNSEHLVSFETSIEYYRIIDNSGARLVD